MPKLIQLTEEQINTMIELYESGMTHKQIGEKLGLHAIKVGRALKKEGVQARKNSFYAVLFNTEEEFKIIEEYESGMNMCELADKYGCSRKAIRNVLIRNNHKFRSPSEAYRKHSINDHYFDSVDNQDKAYILGFLYADGSNGSIYEKNHYYTTMLLQMEDKYILDEMCRRMEMDRGARVIINNTNKKSYAKMEIMNKHMVLRLDELGIVVNKTRKTRFPFWLGKELYPHFIRGYLDGDGCIPKRLDRVHFCGSHGFITDLASVIEKQFGFKQSVGNYKCSEGISYLQICDTVKRLKFLDWIYKDADMKLIRKYNLYLEMKEKYNYKLAG